MRDNREKSGIPAEQKDFIELPKMQNNQELKQISYFQEILRKSIHLSSLTIPIVYCFVTKRTGLLILIPLTLLVLAGDVARRFSPAIRGLVNRYFSRMMRPHELDSSRFLLNGATYVLMSATLCVFIFPKIITIIAFTILIVSDIAAALIGRRYGRRPFLDKSLVGTLAFIGSGILVLIAIVLMVGAPWQLFLVGSIAAVVGGVIEAASIRLRMDDNFSIPISIGFTMWALLYLFEPAVRDSILHLLTMS
jgi:dolichol kinase